MYKMTKTRRWRIEIIIENNGDEPRKNVTVRKEDKDELQKMEQRYLEINTEKCLKLLSEDNNFNTYSISSSFLYYYYW